MKRMQPGPRWGIFALQAAVVVFLVLPFISTTFRDNDQATLLGGSWQIAHSRAPFLHASFYNFDKQWGLYLLLSGALRIFPKTDPLLAGNLLTAALGSLAWLSLGWRTGRTHHSPLPLLLPVLLSPVLILYIPFLGSGWLSLAFLLLAFFFLGNVRSRISGLFGIVLVAAAGACRGDIILAIPALAVSLMSRASLPAFLRRPLPWALAAAAVLPVLAGKQLAGVTIPDTNPLSFTAKSYFGFLVFGLTPATLVVLLMSVGSFLRIAARKARFRFFYTASAIAPLVPFVFYSMQLYTLRYLFLTLASLLFVLGSPRSAHLYRASTRTRLADVLLVVLTITPWLIGLELPSLNHPRLTVANPTRFPTGDGEFPMFAYLGFDWQVLFRDHLAIDHNQRIWQAARSVDYQVCGDGTVPFLITPMSNFIELAVLFQNKMPRPIEYLAASPCGFAYLDARTILRGMRPESRDGNMLEKRIAFASHVRNGQVIVRVDTQARQSPEARLLEDLRQTLGLRYVEMYLSPFSSIPVKTGIDYAVFATGACHITADGQALATKTALIQGSWTSSTDSFIKMTCPDTPLSGWARTVYPPYMDATLAARP